MKQTKKHIWADELGEKFIVRIAQFFDHDIYPTATLSKITKPSIITAIQRYAELSKATQV